jgi:hypothetical protein
LTAKVPLNWLKILGNLKVTGYQGALDTPIMGAFTSPLSMQTGIAAEARGYLNWYVKKTN